MDTRALLTAALVPLALTACDDDVTGIDGETGPRATVAIQFGTQSLAAAAAAGSAAFQQTADGELEIIDRNTGDRLVLSDVQLIVSEFELERLEDSCENEVAEDEDDCEEFEAGPFLLDLPLTASGTLDVVADEVPLGTYTELEFEVENLDADEDDDAEEREAIEAIRSELAAALGFAAPEETSLFVRGRFEQADGEVRPFTTLFEAEIEVEQELVPALVIDDAGATRVITVNLDPAVFFRTAGGIVDLSEFDFATTGELVELEAEFETEFGDAVEVDSDDD